MLDLLPQQLDASVGGPGGAQDIAGNGRHVGRGSISRPRCVRRLWVPVQPSCLRAAAQQASILGLTDRIPIRQNAAINSFGKGASKSSAIRSWPVFASLLARERGRAGGSPRDRTLVAAGPPQPGPTFLHGRAPRLRMRRRDVCGAREATSRPRRSTPRTARRDGSGSASRCAAGSSPTTGMRPPW